VPIEHVDVLIVGAGLSGIGAACHLQRRCAQLSYAIVEGRSESGGTWSLFRFPGVRSDSDAFTFAYSFRPWEGTQSLANGGDILAYLRETARRFGVERHIRYQHRVVAARWSSGQRAWTVEMHAGESGESVSIACDFLYLCCGYYDDAQGYAPHFPGQEAFEGPLVHPQLWPPDLDHAGKRVVVIGSGATAVTLVPAMARDAGHVTMLQRSPSYVVSVPSHDRLLARLDRVLPARWARGLVRAKNIARTTFFYQLFRRAPRLAKAMIRAGARRALPEGFDVDTHFAPRYAPWDQRLCIVPDNDLFKAIGSGRADVVTDEIERITARGVLLKSGRELPADIIVSATGLQPRPCGGVALEVDGAAVDVAHCYVYKGVMLGGVPNLALCFGYSNASWTLRADLSSRFVCKLLNHMRRRALDEARPRCDAHALQPHLLLELTSGYVLRSFERFPKQARQAPWRVRQNYLLDAIEQRFGRIEDGVLQFSSASRAGPSGVAASRASGETL
jgi:cation diffusion facilitator CzcD-associated flavoprotein CzcO